ncbi:MAG: adenosylcobinamide kinase [Lachnospiraceae bacterium]|nr:adenosylcobinamide kinase [Lachnospiraceae bacterium]
MELIIGGAYQGKWEYAKKLFPQAVWVSGENCTLEELLAAEGVYDFHNFLGRQMEQGADLEKLPELILEKNPGLVIVSDEVGYGVVPIDAGDRAFREAVGRVCCELAARAQRVHRVVCGIGTVIKDA